VIIDVAATLVMFLPPAPIKSGCPVTPDINPFLVVLSTISLGLTID
jgi:hypothetical protein